MFTVFKYDNNVHLLNTTFRWNCQREWRGGSEGVERAEEFLGIRRRICLSWLPLAARLQVLHIDFDVQVPDLSLHSVPLWSGAVYCATAKHVHTSQPLTGPIGQLITVLLWITVAVKQSVLTTWLRVRTPWYASSSLNFHVWRTAVHILDKLSPPLSLHPGSYCVLKPGLPGLNCRLRASQHKVTRLVYSGTHIQLKRNANKGVRSITGYHDII